MKSWQARQRVYRLLTKDEDLGDRIEDQIVVEEFEEDVVVERALQYVSMQSPCLFYPGKSYAVAIIYALLLKQYFNEDVVTALCDPSLLGGDDPYFVPYAKSKKIYDRILARFPLESVLSPSQYSEDFQKTCHYFQLEMLIHESTAIYAPT